MEVLKYTFFYYFIKSSFKKIECLFVIKMKMIDLPGYLMFKKKKKIFRE